MSGFAVRQGPMDLCLVIREIRHCEWCVDLTRGQGCLTSQSISVKVIQGAWSNPWGLQDHWNGGYRGYGKGWDQWCWGNALCVFHYRSLALATIVPSSDLLWSPTFTLPSSTTMVSLWCFILQAACPGNNSAFQCVALEVTFSNPSPSPPTMVAL
jgi:hypothetical protein